MTIEQLHNICRSAEHMSPWCPGCPVCRQMTPAEYARFTAERHAARFAYAATTPPALAADFAAQRAATNGGSTTMRTNITPAPPTPDESFTPPKPPSLVAAIRAARGLPAVAEPELRSAAGIGTPHPPELVARLRGLAGAAESGTPKPPSIVAVLRDRRG